MKKPKTAAIVYSDVKRRYFPTEEQYLTEKDAVKDAKVIAKYFVKLGIKPMLYPANSVLPKKLKKDKPDMVLNLVGSVKGEEYLAASIPGVMELLEIPYTGTGILGESLSYNKFLVKKLLQQHGIPVPNYQLIVNPNQNLDSILRFPLISKLNEIHGSVEITNDAVSENEKHLRSRLKYLIKTYKADVLVEEFIVGREITCMIVESMKKKVYLAERIFNSDNKYVIATFETQWKDKKNKLSHYSKFSDPVLTEYVKKAFDITNMEDYGKFDVRLDESGRYYFIDSNSNPYFGPVELQGDISMILKMYGINFLEILKRLISNTMQQYNNPT
ncbi:hypothetical protein A3D76_04175 [Candidatus Roizmanbacteria bacterium RIFCSPHIGHO2_02_FULL_37_9b]|nr:MAG: hypothetical protein A3D76_04175 [Candidatus Roizmanbacteria bacterium RIFCSPHIGHO2_02_FULL_37_9b]